MKFAEKLERRYWELIEEHAAILGSDGCSFGTGRFRNCCLEHDIHYRLHRSVFGKTITREWADDRFFDCMVRQARWGYFDPQPWWRWALVRLFGKRAWDARKDGSPVSHEKSS